MIIIIVVVFLVVIIIIVIVVKARVALAVARRDVPHCRLHGDSIHVVLLVITVLALVTSIDVLLEVLGEVSARGGCGAGVGERGHLSGARVGVAARHHLASIRRQRRRRGGSAKGSLASAARVVVRSNTREYALRAHTDHVDHQVGCDASRCDRLGKFKFGAQLGGALLVVWRGELLL
jgi:hypothetical protein